MRWWFSQTIVLWFISLRYSNFKIRNDQSYYLTINRNNKDGHNRHVKQKMDGLYRKHIRKFRCQIGDLRDPYEYQRDHQSWERSSLINMYMDKIYELTPHYHVEFRLKNPFKIEIYFDSIVILILRLQVFLASAKVPLVAMQSLFSWNNEI